ncbi:MAG: zf-TFIIB domain-containing protein [Planctomycetota bacterium]
MYCPKCSSKQLKETTVKGTDVRVDYCPECRGIWFDRSELETVSSAAEERLSVPRDATRTALICPRCSEALHSFKYPETLVTIDMCKACGGLWLDSGEFKEIRVVRKKLKRTGALSDEPEPGGIKGGLLGFINSAISSLSNF